MLVCTFAARLNVKTNQGRPESTDHEPGYKYWIITLLNHFNWTFFCLLCAYLNKISSHCKSYQFICLLSTYAFCFKRTENCATRIIIWTHFSCYLVYTFNNSTLIIDFRGYVWKLIILEHFARIIRTCECDFCKVTYEMSMFVQVSFDDLMFYFWFLCKQLYNSFNSSKLV